MSSVFWRRPLLAGTAEDLVSRPRGAPSCERRSLDRQVVEEFVPLRRQFRHALMGPVADIDLVEVTALSQLEGAGGRERGTGALEPEPHHPLANESQKADERTGTDALGSRMSDRRDLDVASQYPETAFDISQTFVPLDNLFGRQAVCVGE
jgi:hypothetical protein